MPLWCEEPQQTSSWLWCSHVIFFSWAPENGRSLNPPSDSHTGKQKGERGEDGPQQVLVFRKRSKTREASVAACSRLERRESKARPGQTRVVSQRRGWGRFSAEEVLVCPPKRHLSSTSLPLCAHKSSATDRQRREMREYSCNHTRRLHAKWMRLACTITLKWQ